MFTSCSSKLSSTLLLILVAMFNGCGPASSTFDGDMQRLARKSGGAFNGTWNVKLKASKDECQLGLVGKTQPAKIVIAQSGKSIKLSIQGIPKQFRGSINGLYANASGTYKDSGFTLTGNVTATKKNSNAIKITTAKLQVKTAKSSCNITFSGSGTKARSSA